jgi:hypothetical protein
LPFNLIVGKKKAQKWIDSSTLLLMTFKQRNGKIINKKIGYAFFFKQFAYHAKIIWTEVGLKNIDSDRTIKNSSAKIFFI